MAGKHKSEKERGEIAARSRALWADPQSKFNSEAFRNRKSEIAVSLFKRGIIGGRMSYSNAKRGWYTNGGKRYFMRSGWELEYATYLDRLEEKEIIASWEYEPDIFWFESIKRGARSYTPDFKIFKADGMVEYHEVKGYMDKKSATKLKRMRKYYPNIRLVLIDAPKYKAIMKNKGVLQLAA